ncbi:MAG: hypothetical protein ACP5JM_06240 [Thermoplasmata archaeon]
MEVFETSIPGLGKKFTFKGSGGEFSVISKLDGTKEIYFAQGDSFVVVPMMEDEARILAMLLLESYYERKEGRAEISTGRSTLRWIYVEEDEDIPLNEYMRNALFLIRNGKLERDLSIKPRKGDLILAGD